MSQEFDESISKITKEEISGRGIAVGYRAVSILAIIAFVLSLFTPLMLLSNWFIIFPMIGAICGIFGLHNILSCPFDYTGRGFALGGIIFSFLLGIGSAGWGIWHYYFSIPYGYTVVQFTELLPVDERSNKLPDHILKLAKEERKIYIKGYMYPGRKSVEQDFTLVRTQEHCKFCSPQQNPFDMIYVHCLGDLRATYRSTKAIYVGGTLYVNEEFKYGELPYYIEADLVR